MVPNLAPLSLPFLPPPSSAGARCDFHPGCSTPPKVLLVAMRNFPALLLLLSLVVVANLAQVPCLPEVELAEAATNALRLRRLHTARPAPLGYPPPPTVAGPPTTAPAPSPSE